MTLLELLKQGLKEWPDDVVGITQDLDYLVSYWRTTDVYLFESEEFEDKYWLPVNRESDASCGHLASTLASDYTTAIITREMYYDTNL